MACAGGPLPEDVFARIERIVPISGLFDLRPLMWTAMNETLRLDAAEAAAESPALLPARAPVPVTAWVGGGERPEFVRQSQLLALVWEGLDVPVRCIVDGRHDHFSVLDGLSDPDGALARTFAGDA
jgi:hypothetical protein